jgi:nickel superoxide dismutase
MHTTIRTTLAIAFLAVLSRGATSHCQIPCGIYDDLTRARLLREHVTTVEKSIRMINELSAKKDRTPTEDNQLVRWVVNKEQHADAMRDIVVEYFLQQRIKAPKEGGADGLKTYGEILTVCHEILVTTMKAKQTADSDIPGKLRAQLKRLEALYFSDEDRKHLREHQE